MHAFMAAPFTGHFDGVQNLVDHGLARYLITMAAELERAGHSVFSAHRREQFGRDLWPPNLCTPFDRVEMQLADCVVAFPGRSYGVHVELGWASALLKPILIVTEEPAAWQTPLVEGLSTLSRCEVLVAPAQFLERPETCAETIAAICRWVDAIARTNGSCPRYGIFNRHGSHAHLSAMASLANALRRNHAVAEIHAFTPVRGSASEVCDFVLEIDVETEQVVAAVQTVAERYAALFSIGESLLVERWRRPTGVYAGEVNRAWMRTPDDRIVHSSLSEVTRLVEDISTAHDTVPVGEFL
jgi:hypothetical protein